MSEAERRRSYLEHRVLIESARVLSPQYADAVVYLSGAQLELLRNVTQYLRRQDTYVDEHKLGYYVMPDADDYDSILEIVADLEEALMGNPNTLWGYKDRWHDPTLVQSVGAASTYASSDAVPEGYVYVLEHWTLVHFGGTTCSVLLSIDVGGNNPMLYSAPALASGVYVYQGCNYTLKEGDKITLEVGSLPNTAWCAVLCYGHMMVVPA